MSLKLQDKDINRAMNATMQFENTDNAEQGVPPAKHRRSHIEKRKTEVSQR